VEHRLVVTFRASGGSPRAFPDRARALVDRLAPLGAEHVGWDVSKLTFAFPPEALGAVLDVLGSGGEDVVADELPWAVGMAEGELRPVADGSSPLLASGFAYWGAAFVAASTLANVARAGEVVSAESVSAVRTGDLLTYGRRVARDGTLRVRGLRLDPKRP